MQQRDIPHGGSEKRCQTKRNRERTKESTAVFVCCTTEKGGKLSKWSGSKRAFPLSLVLSLSLNFHLFSRHETISLCATDGRRKRGRRWAVELFPLAYRRCIQEIALKAFAPSRAPAPQPLSQFCALAAVRYCTHGALQNIIPAWLYFSPYIKKILCRAPLVVQVG